MPHVQPLLATERVSFRYHTNNQDHVMQTYCQAVSHAIAPTHDLVTSLAGTVDADTAFQALAAEFAAQLLTTDTVDDYILEHWNGVTYVPIQNGSIGLAGSQTASGTPYSRITGFYRDEAFNPVKIVEICATYFVPLHENPAALPNPFKAFWQSWYTHATGRAGLWAQSKSAIFLANVENITGSLDRKSRRRAGLV